MIDRHVQTLDGIFGSKLNNESRFVPETVATTTEATNAPCMHPVVEDNNDHNERNNDDGDDDDVTS